MDSIVKVIILMGVSGAGKSTYARGVEGAFMSERKDRPAVRFISADLYRGLYISTPGTFADENDGKAVLPRPALDFTKLGAAHAWAFRNFIANLQNGRVDAINGRSTLIMVDNTNTTGIELAPYIAAARAFGVEPEIHHIRSGLSNAELAARNLHGCPVHGIERQRANIETTLSEWPPFWPVPSDIG